MADICLVHMPFSQLGHPSMALSVLVSECRAKNLEASICYGNMRFAQQVGLREYDCFLQFNKLFMLIGECLFKPYAGFTDHCTSEDFFAQMERELERGKPFGRTWYEQLRNLYKVFEPKVEDYLEQMADHILASKPKIVGCDITYEQRNASLALCRILKQKQPELITLLGGNSCTGKRGKALVEAFNFIDGVFSGEADHIFPQVCRQLLAGKDIKAVQKEFPSLLLPGTPVINNARPSMEECAFVDFDDYFYELHVCGLDKNVQPCLLIEGSRGCWWGEKQPCTFCGIHTSKEGICYRAKSPARLFSELEHLQECYGISSFVFTDCILSHAHVEELTKLLIGSKYQYNLFAEIKSNLTAQQIKQLRQAGFVLLQPGIESLQDDLLKLMNKGNRAIKHVELLKRCKQYGIGVVWNMLKEMPFDKADYYEETLELSKKLSHLQPPAHLSTILYQGNSIYNNNPEKFGLKLEPMPLYGYIGAVNEEFIRVVADVFDNVAFKPNPDKEKAFGSLDNWIGDWIEEYNSGSHLSYSVRDSIIDVIDLRRCAKHFTYTLTGVEKQVYELVDTVIRVDKLKEKLAHIGDEEIAAAIAYLEQKNLLISIGDEVLGLAVKDERLPYARVPELPVGVIKA